jgi:hypothetical protein
MKNANEKKDLVIHISDNFTKIIHINEIKETILYWGGNGAGDRFANKMFNYTAIYLNKSIKLYSENDDDIIPEILLNKILNVNTEKCNGIIGIFVHSFRLNIQTRPIHKDIGINIRGLSCVICGTQKTVCDHKNDLYNDERVLCEKTQLLCDFQPLCNHCNLQKRQICKIDKIYSAKNIQRYKVYLFEFPWEKKYYDINDINCKTDTYWYDPVEFDKKIHYYTSYTIPIINEIKQKVRANKIKLIQ